MTFRPAREISIQVRRSAVHDPANYDPGPPSQALPAQPNRWPLRLLIVAFTGLAFGLSLMAVQLPAPWAWPTAAVASTTVWVFWKVTHLGARLDRPRHKGRHRRSRRPSPISEIDRPQAMLDADTHLSARRQGERGLPAQTKVSRVSRL